MSNTKKKTTEEFILDAKLIHGNKYDYSKVEYVRAADNVCIICPEHGNFWQTPKVHLRGKGCKECGKHKSKQKGVPRKRKLLWDKNNKSGKYVFEDFLSIAKSIYGTKYDYSKVDYKSFRMDKVCIICPIHGEFWQFPYKHIQGCGCVGCVTDKKKKLFSSNTEDFIRKSNDIFHNHYTYENVSYVNNASKVSITCDKHGEFLCTPANHLKGRGCPICKSEKYVYEGRLYNLLLSMFNENEIYRQYTVEWLTNRKSIDFYIQKYDIAIEHQGSQHFFPIKFLGGEKKYLRTIELDKEKYEECKNNGVKLLYFSYEKCVVPTQYIDTIYVDENELINEINNIIKNKKK